MLELGLACDVCRTERLTYQPVHDTPLLLLYRKEGLSCSILQGGAILGGHSQCHIIPKLRVKIESRLQNTTVVVFFRKHQQWSLGQVHELYLTKT